MPETYALLLDVDEFILRVAALQHEVDPVPAVVVTDPQGHVKVLVARRTSMQATARAEARAFVAAAVEAAEARVGLVPVQREGER